MITKNIIITTSLLILTACGSSINFVRPADSKINLGETKRGQIIAMLHRNADSIGQKTINNTMIDTMEYSYLSRDNTLSDTPSEVGHIAVKGQLYYLVNNTVIGSEYHSTFAKDTTKFDITKVPSIKKGKTTKEDIINMFGKPSIKLTRPLISDKATGAIGYHYRTMNLASPTDLKTTAAKLIIEYDADGIIINVSFESKNNKAS